MAAVPGVSGLQMAFRVLGSAIYRLEHNLKSYRLTCSFHLVAYVGSLLGPLGIVEVVNNIVLFQDRENA